MKNKASLKSKISRRFKNIILHKLRLGKWIYASYRHREKKPVSDDLSMLYLTQIPNDGAGIGHQIANHNGGVYMAEVLGLHHAYSPFTDKKWDDFLGFGENEPSIKELLKKGYKMRTLPYFSESEESLDIIRKIIKSYGGQKIVFNIELDQFYQRQYDVIPYIKHKFENAAARKAEQNPYIYSDGKCHINMAVHVRRGDINIGQTTGEATLTKRWLDMEYFENIVKDVSSNPEYYTELLKKHGRLLSGNEIVLDIYIFSQGNIEDYRSFEKYGNVHYCLDMSAMESFLYMVRSDILVTSKSSFSYKPALLADGIRICPAGFWHGYPDDELWIVREN